MPPAEPIPQAVSKSTPASTEPKSGGKAIFYGKPHIWIPGFGWIEDDGGGSVGTMIGSPGDELTGNKVGIMDGGTTVGGKGDIAKQVGIMGGAESAPSNTSTPTSAEPEIIGDVIYVPLQPPVTKESTPPAYKPNGEPIDP